MAERLRVGVEPTICVGSRMCQMVAPEVFRVETGTGQAAVLQPEVDESDEIWDAAEGCPREAVSLTRVDTGEQVFP